MHLPDSLLPPPEMLPPPVTYNGYTEAEWEKEMIDAGIHMLQT